MLYIEKFYSRDFKADNAKQAYMLASEFVAKNILSKGSKVEVDRVTWRIERNKKAEGNLPTFRLTLYVTFDDKEMMKQTCDACKEFHNLFYVNQDFNCSRCNKVGYEKNVQQRLHTCAAYFKKMLSNELGDF